MPNTVQANGEAMPVETQSLKKRLAAILEEAGKIIRDNPDMMIDRVTVTEDGIYTKLTIPGTEEHPWTKARRLMKELSGTLADCDSAKWSAYVMPPVPPVLTGSPPIQWGKNPTNCRLITSSACRGSFRTL